MTTLQDWNLENLYKCPNFFGELSEENAKDILREAFQNGNGKTKYKGILFLMTVTDEIGKDHFTIVRAGYFGPENPNPFYFTKSSVTIAHQIFFPSVCAALRKNPPSLEELAKVKIATSGIDLEPLYLPNRIKNELKKYQELNKTFIGLADWQYFLTRYGPPGNPTPPNTPN